jgi:ribosomal protein S18 acetylase RimI-like enzyme
MTLAVQEMTPADYDEAMALWRACDGIGLSAADSREGINAYLARNAGLSLVARLEGRLVGTCLCGHDGRRGYLHHLAVAADHRGQGLGRALAEGCLERLAAAGIDKCHVFIRADNWPAEAFWQALGWQERTDLKMMSQEVRPGGGSA